MKKKILVGSGLSAIVLAGLAFGTKSQEVLADTRSEGVLLDYTIFKEDPVVPKAGYAMAQARFAQDGVTFTYYTVPRDNWVTTMASIAKKYGTTAQVLTNLNAASLSRNVLIYSNSYIYAGARVLVNNNGHTSNPKYYYNLSMKAPVDITGSNWNKKKSNYVTTDGRYESGRFLNYSLSEHLMKVSDINNTLTLNGWAVQNNYTDTSGTNNRTAIIARDQKTKSVVITNASNKAVNPSPMFVYNENNPGAEQLRCPAVDAYLDKPVNFERYGTSANTSMIGCWHNFANSGFQASLNLETLFGGAKNKNVYDLFIANSTGANAGRILYKELSARQSITRTYSNSRFSGTVSFKANGTNVLPNNQIAIVEDGVLLMRKYVNGKTTNSTVNWVGGSNNFKAGRYIVSDTAIHKTTGTQYYYLTGTGATAGYKGWSPQTSVDDSKNPASLSFKIDKWEKFQLNHVDYASGNVIDKSPNQYTVYANTGLGATSVTVRRSTFNRITDNKGVVWTLMPTSVVPENKDFTRKFDADNIPADATYKYSKIYKSTVRYVNANTGKEIRSEVKDIEFGKTLSYSYKNLGVVDGSNANFVTYSGKKYKFAGTGVSSYLSEMNVLGTPQKYKDDIAKYKNTATQSRLVSTSNVSSGVDDVIFYFYEPQPYTVNHMRVDSSNNFVRANGTKVGVPSEGVLHQEHGLYYTGDTINVFAYGIGVAGKPTQSSFGNYFFSGRGRFQNTGVYLNGTNMASGKSTFKMPLARIATKPQGDVAYLFYRRAITNPTGYVTIGTDPTNPTVPADKSHPGNGNGTGVAVNPNAYLPSITGQYNWYLTKENNVNSANWNKSKLAMSNVASVGNNNVFAVKKLKNRIQVNGKNAYVSSYTGETTDLYYGTVAQTRKVNPVIGEGIALSNASKVQMKLPTTFNSSTASNVSSIYASRKYTNLVEKVAMNSKIYKSGASNYNDALGQVAGKGATITYQTTYDFTNRVRDNYVAKDWFYDPSRVFEWEYSYSSPVFLASGKYDYKATSKVDHKLGEESTTPLKKAGDKLVSKVGSLRNYTNQGTNNATDTVNNGSANTVTLNETITKVETINPTLKTQSKVKAEENLTYKNDITTYYLLSTRGHAKETFVGYEDSFNGFTYNATNTGYNKYLVQDVDFNFRNVNGSVASPNMGKVSATGTTNLESGYNYQMGVKVDNLSKLPRGMTTQTVKLNLDNQYGVLSDSGLLIERARGLSLDSSNGTYYKTVTQNAFGKAYEISSSDKLVKQTGTYVGYYYLPVDGNSTLKPNTVYTNRNVLSSVGLNDRNIAIDNTFQFSNYLVGSSVDNTAYASFKTSLSKDGDYTDNKIVITSKEKEAIKSSNEVVSKDNVNFRTMNAKEITNTLKKFLGFQN